MFEVYRLSETEIMFFALVLIRVTSCLVALPIYGTRTIPAPAKVLLGLAVVFVLFPVVRPQLPVGSEWTENIVLLSAREAFIGLLMGFVARMIFFAVEVAGQIVGFSMGLSAAQLVNPAFGESSSVVEQFKGIMAILLFLAINGHHLYFEAMYQSFQLAPAGQMRFGALAMASLSGLLSETFQIAMKLAGPMTIIMVLLNLAVGVIGKFVPQINVFVVSFSVSILGGLFVFAVSLPLILHVLETDMFQMTSHMFEFVKGF
ncbi:MAG: flagellar biosynthetic protein FliR [Oligoflexia bacterium]|nr:flagellar biosynthetic protein FliR [Oligoflexia bacterium]